MLDNLTVVFPLATALFALLWFLRWARLHRRAPLAETSPEARPFFTRNDALALGAVTLVYTVTAFANLGDTKAPQSFLRFEAANYYAEIDLGEPRNLTGLRYYTGLVPADYRLQVSADGETWAEQTREDGSSPMTQTYNQILRWCDAYLDPANGPVRYVRIISGADQELGEIALYADGRLLTPEEFSVAPGGEALADEQDLIPARTTFRNGTYFDEIYYPRTVKELRQGMWPYEITHPPLGKSLMGLGVRLFGLTPFGWRFMGTFLGVLMLPALYVLLKRMFGDTAAATAGTTVFAFDFMHFVQTRIATIDTFAVFFILLMFLFLYLWLTEPEGRPGRKLLWLGLCGLSFGLGAASKWTCLYAGAGLGVIWALHWGMRLAREKSEALTPFLQNVLWCLLFFVLIPAAVYYASYWDYAPSQGITGAGRLFTRGYAKLVWDNQTYMWNYHSKLVATHPYSSMWYQWLLDIRPILYYLEYFDDGTKAAFGAFSNPLVCWGGLLAMGGMAWIAVRDRDERAVFILLGYLANLLPWVFVPRLTFAYHYFPCTLFLALALGYLFADLRRRSYTWPVSVGSFTAVCVGLFVMFYPVLGGVRASMDYTTFFLKWFSDTWPF